MVAFTLGFVSHQVADVTWDSLGIEQGFLTTMGDVNFFGSFSAAHSVGDPGVTWWCHLKAIQGKYHQALMNGMLTVLSLGMD